jgi:excisionase family DNA binding protein
MSEPLTAVNAAGCYSTDDLCRLLGLSLRTVRRLIAAGRIPGQVKLPARRLRWSRAKIDAWLAAGR